MTWGPQDAAALPRVMTGAVRIHGNGQLTLEPGVELRFASGTGLYVGGGWDDPGTLIAQGTQTHPIRFTSHQPAPAPGDWQGLYFDDGTVNGTTLLDWCEVEYGGHTHGSNVYVLAASPTLQHNIIRESSNYGLYITGTGSNGALIRYNDVTQNPYGVYTASNAAPAINYNNIAGNTSYGLYNTSSGVTLNAENNYWGADSGPYDPSDDTATGGLYNLFGAGDQVTDYVDYDPWEGQEITNSLPYTSHTPDPANNAVNVPLDAGSVTLSWTGGDPDAWDSVTYTIRLG